MKQCCAICTNLDENICCAHSRGCEAIVRYPFCHGETCRDFDEDQEAADYYDSLSEDELASVIRESTYQPEE